MNRKFTKLMAALALLLFIAPPMVGWGQIATFDAVTDITNTTPSNQGYQTTELTINANDGTEWKAIGYMNKANEYIQIGKGGANYLKTPVVDGNISSVSVTWSGNTDYYLALKTIGGTEIEAHANPSTATTYTFNISEGEYSQLMLVGRRNSGNSNAAAYISKVIVNYTSGPATYTVTYNGNGADGGTAVVDPDSPYEANETVTVLANTFTKTGHTFEWWSDMEDGTDDNANLYEEDDTFEITENTTLYAQWSVNTYNYSLSITGDDNEAMAELEVDGSTVESGTKIAYDKEVTVVVATHTGYNYSIEVKDADNNDIPVVNDKFNMPASDVTVTVTTTLIPTYTITFDAGTGTCITPSMSDLEGSTITLPTATPSEACASRGWVFAGWATTSVSETTTVPTLLNGDYTITADADLYAVYQVTEEGQGGETVFNFEEIATQNGWSSGTAYTTVSIDPITLTANGGGNNGKYYSSDHSWRLYNGGSVTITSTTGSVTSVESVPSKEFTLNSDGSASCSFSATTQFTEITVTSSISTTTYNSNPSCLPKVATPTFNPAAGKVKAGTTVAISCDTEGAAIQYSTDNGTTWTNYTAALPINGATTIQAKATKVNYVDSEVATAQYTIAGSAVFVDGVYSEPLDTQDSFENMTAVNVQGDEGWYFETEYECVTINGAASGDVDWLITPKMQVDNGKLAISFLLWHSSSVSGLLAVKWSTSNDVNGEWNNIEFEDVAGDGSFHEVDVEITTEEPNVYLAFVYDNTTLGAAGSYSIAEFIARQCKTLTVSNLDHVNTYLFAGTESEMLLEGEGEALIGVGMEVMISVDPYEDYQLASLLVNGDQHIGDIEGGMYIFPMPNGDVAVSASATAIPYYYVSYSTNGIADGTAKVVQGEAIGTLPTATAEYIPAGYEFMGWLDSEYQESDDAPDAYIGTAYKPNSDVTLYAVFAEVSGTTSVGTLTETEITTNITNTTCAYGTAKTYNDTDDGITWVASCYTDAANRKWMQLKDDATAYIKVIAQDNITSVDVTITGNTNSSGGINDITKHTAFSSSGTVYLNTQAGKANNANIHVGSASGSNVSNYILTVVPTGNYNTLFIQTNPGSRIWGISVTSGSVSYSNYRTSLLTDSDPLAVEGYTLNSDGGYKLIATPVYVSPSTVNGMTTDEFDLYYFDEAQDREEWRNYEASSFNLEPGKGYLYAKLASSNDPYEFVFSGTPYNGDGEVALSYTEGNQFAGWNLIGNPFTTAATLDMPFYKMNSDGDGFTAKIEDLTNTIAAMEGVFVQATAANQTATFTAPSRNGGRMNTAKMELMVIGNRGTVIDNAIVRFDEGQTLEKFMFNANGTKLYFTEGNQDYAIVRSNAEGEMPVNFKAETSGTYTISVNAENTEMNYLHLIDNKTGADIDLLATPSYSFEAKTSDYASRFRLVFSGSSTSSETAETFAYYNGSEWVINNMGDATLQVVDVMGRVLSSETVSGNATLSTSNLSAGVYVMRLINGENAMTQKIVVR